MISITVEIRDTTKDRVTEQQVDLTTIPFDDRLTRKEIRARAIQCLERVLEAAGYGKEGTGGISDHSS